MRPRMYGSTDMKAFRISTCPSAGSPTSTSASSKSVGFGIPRGRAARRHSRLFTARSYGPGALLCGPCEPRRAGRAAALLEVLLVVVLRLVELLRVLDLRDDRFAVVRLLGVARGLRRGALLVVVDEDDAAVIVSDVPALAVQLRRVVLAPEDAEQVVVRDLRGVVGDLDDLGVARGVRAHVLVRRVAEMPAVVADAGARHAVELAERGLHAPEAAGAERGLLLQASSPPSSGRAPPS